MSFSLTDSLLAFLIFQLGFVGLFLISLTRGKRISNVLLGGFFISLALNLLDTLLLIKGVYAQHPAWGLWGVNLALLFGPLLWLHTQSVIFRDFRPGWRHLLHALPFLALTLVSQAGYQTQSPDRQQQILRDVLAQQLPAGFYVVSAGILAHFFTYLFLSLGLVRRYRRTLSEQFSAIQNKNVNWLAQTLLFFILFFALSIVQNVLRHTPLVSYKWLVLLALLLALFGFINRFLLRALRSPDVFAGITTDELTPPPAATLPVADHAPLLARLATLMEQEKPYRQPELTLDDLAGQLGVRPKQLSAALNDGLGQHFFDYVNRYRIEEARRILTTSPDPKLTVLEVMYDVGFNSKSSFNTLFRKYTGQTPSEVKRRAA